MATTTTLTRDQIDQHTVDLLHGSADIDSMLRGDHLTSFPPLTDEGNESFTDKRLYSIIIEEMEHGVTDRGRAAFGRLFSNCGSLDWIADDICRYLNITD